MIRLVQAVAVMLGVLPTVYGSDVKILNAENFQKSVLETTDLWLIELASPDQFILEERMDGIPRKLAKSGVRVGSLDCADQSNMKLCHLYGFRGSYALSGFFEPPELNPYSKKMIRKYEGFVGGTTPKAIEKFISKGCPNLITRINTSGELQDMVLSSERNTAIIISEKETPSMFYKTLAVRFSKYPLNFVYIRSTDMELTSAFPDVSEFPAMIMFSGGDALPYEGDLGERAELILWLKEFAGNEEEVVAEKPSAGSGDDLLAKLKDLAGTERAMSQVVAVVRGNADAEVSNWSKFVEEADSAVELREIRCESDDSAHELFNAVCASESNTIPFVIVMPYGPEEKKKALKNLSKHSMPITSLDAAHRKALDSIPNLVTVINAYDPPERMNQFLVEGVKANLISILVFSDKANPPMALKGLAAAEAKHLQVGFVSEPTDELLGNFGWSRDRGIPAALGAYYSDGSREKQSKDTAWEKGPDAGEGTEVGFRVLYYEPDMLGPMRFTTLRMFAASVYQKSGLASANSGTAGSTGTTSKAQEAIDIISSEADWNNACPDSMLGICVIGFLNAPADARPEDAYLIDKTLLSTLTNVMTAVQKDSPVFHFVAANIACLSDFGSSFTVDPFNTPVIAIYSPGKGRFALNRGSFSESELRTFLGQVLRGAETTHPMSRPVIADDVDCTAGPLIGTAESDSLDGSDAEDFLAEIRKEEEARAAQIEKELAEEKARLAEADKKGSKKKKSTKKKKTTKKEL